MQSITSWLAVTEMRKRWALAAIVLLLIGSFTHAQATVIAGQAVGPDPFRLFFDEKGNGSYQRFDPVSMIYGPSVNDQGVVVTDPTTATGTALQYALPEAVETGCCLAIAEPGATTTCTASDCSDAVRFLQIGDNFFIRYYSNDKLGELADTGLPSDFDPAVTVTEVDLDGANSFQYVAGPGPEEATNFYNGISAAAPVQEPTTIALLGAAFVSLFGVRRALRRRS